VTVLIASHALNEVEAHADRVAILQQGKLLACGTLTELSEQAALPVRLHIACDSRAMDRVAGTFNGLLNGRIIVRRVDARNIELDCAHADKMTVLRQVADLGDSVVDVDITPPRLDEIYAHFIASGRLS
jgi:Cu-processing system ATP-binding protein